MPPRVVLNVGTRPRRQAVNDSDSGDDGSEYEGPAPRHRRNMPDWGSGDDDDDDEDEEEEEEEEEGPEDDAEEEAEEEAEDGAAENEESEEEVVEGAEDEEMEDDAEAGEEEEEEVEGEEASDEEGLDESEVEEESEAEDEAEAEEAAEEELAETEEADGESSRMTERQKAKLAGNKLDLADLGDLDVGTRSKSRKKVLSVEEQRIKRAELARRRRNLSQRRLEEEKQDTLDKLLKKRAGRSQNKDDLEEHDAASSQGRVTKSRLLPPHPALISWRSTSNGFTLSMTPERARIDGLSKE